MYSGSLLAAVRTNMEGSMSFVCLDDMIWPLGLVKAFTTQKLNITAELHKGLRKHTAVG